MRPTLPRSALWLSIFMALLCITRGGYTLLFHQQVLSTQVYSFTRIAPESLWATWAIFSGTLLAICLLREWPISIWRWCVKLVGFHWLSLAVLLFFRDPTQYAGCAHLIFYGMTLVATYEAQRFAEPASLQKNGGSNGA